MSKRADAIKEKVSIYDILGRYGYGIIPNHHVEQQFSCDLHGDTMDDRPSARVYPDSNSWYCFACGKSRDAIETVRDKESCDFNKACFFIEEWYGLPHFVYKEKDDGKPTSSPMDRISASEATDLDSVQSQIDKLLRIAFIENIIDKRGILKMWEMFDIVAYHLNEGKWDEESCLIRYGKIKNKVMSMMSGEV